MIADFFKRPPVKTMKDLKDILQKIENNNKILNPNDTQCKIDITLITYEYQENFLKLKQFNKKIEDQMFTKENKANFIFFAELYVMLISSNNNMNIYFVCNKFPFCVNSEIYKAKKKLININESLLCRFPELIELFKQYSKKIKMKIKKQESKCSNEIEIKINGKEKTFFTNAEINLGVQFMFDYIIKIFLDKEENFSLPLKIDKRIEIERENNIFEDISDKKKQFSNILLTCCRRDSTDNEDSKQSNDEENEEENMNDFDMGFLVKNNIEKKSKIELENKESGFSCILI